MTDVSIIDGKLNEINRRLEEGNRKFESIDNRFSKFDEHGTRICTLNKAGVEQISKDVHGLKSDIRELFNTSRNHVYIAASILGVLYTILTLWRTP